MTTRTILCLLWLAHASCTDETAHYGEVEATAFRTATQQGGSIAARFSATCRPSTQGACELWTCSADSSLAAGKIALDDATGETLISVAPEPGTDNAYPTVLFDSLPPQPLFDDGVNLQLVAIGGEVPAFSAALVAPSLVTVAEPLVDIARGSDLTFHWTGASAGDVVVSLAGTVASNIRVQCRFPAGDGTGTVPAAAMQVLPAGGGSYFFWTESAQLVRVADWTIHAKATVSAVRPDQSHAGGFVTYH